MTRSYILNEIKDYALIAVGVILYTLGVTVFMLPYELTTGGVAGISSIIYYVTGLEVQITYIAINVCFLAVAIKVLGIKFCIKTIYAVLLVTFMLWLQQRLIEIPNPDDPSKMMLPQLIGSERFMACVLGAIICGIGLAVCFENNGSTGGTDIIAAIVNKYKPMSLGSVIMACDVVIISSCYFVFHDWARVIYGFVMLFVCSLTLDYCIRRRHQSVQFFIFSRNYSRIASAITQSGHGVTILEGQGWYTRSERKVIVTIVRRTDSNIVLRLIKMIDPYAFVSMSDTQGVYGEAFDPMKVSSAKGERQKTIIVYATTNLTDVAEAQQWLGDGFDVRTLNDVGCDLSQSINAVMIDGTAKFKACHVKKFYGFDSIALEDDGTYTLVRGNYDDIEYDISEHLSREQIIEILTPKKTNKYGTKKA